MDDVTNHASDIVGIGAYEAPLPQKKGFLPWHRPRKQFVREKQWCRQIQLLLDESPRDQNILKYLGLPGNDLLDLRYFHTQICEARKLQLRFLGFNTAANPASLAQTDLNISLDEVRKLSSIDPGSDIIWDDFCRITNDDSLAWRKTRDLGPYDVINLDLCDGFGAHAPSPFDATYYNAVNQLLSLQARQKNSWLLLLTTRAGRDHVHTDVLGKLVEKYVQNLQECEPFRDESTSTLGLANAAAVNEATTSPAGLLPVFLIGLAKWLVGIAVNQQPPSKVEVKSVIGYKVDSDAAVEDLISIAFRFEPTFVPAEDPLGLANRPTPEPDECQLSAKALKRISKRKDVDAILQHDHQLLQEMITASASLLELARYDGNEYRAWVGA